MMTQVHYCSSNTKRLVLYGLGLCIILLGCAPTVMLPGSDVVNARLSENTFIARDNTTLPVKCWLPQQEKPNAVIIALHGFNDYSNFFDQSGQQLQARGIASFAYDQRGFGQSPHPGLWSGAQAMAQDLTDFVAVIKSLYTQTPIYLLGESMGGAVVMVTMTQSNAPQVEGIILAAPAVWGISTMPWYQRWALSLGSYTLPWMTVTGRGLKIKPSDNRPMLIKLGKDPLVIKKTRIDAIHGLTHLMSLALERSQELDSAALILYGELDEIIPKAPTAMMLSRLPNSAKKQHKIALYEGGYHMLLRDLNADLPLQDIIAWINNPQQPLPSGADQRPISSLLEKQSKNLPDISTRYNTSRKIN